MKIKKLIIVEEGGSIKILPAEISEEDLISADNWLKDFIVDQTNLGDMHAAFLTHVFVTKEKK